MPPRLEGRSFLKALDWTYALPDFWISGWLSKVDYISCVSGGACSAASFFSHAACRQRKTETDEEKGAGIDAKECETPSPFVAIPAISYTFVRQWQISLRGLCTS